MMVPVSVFRGQHRNKRYLFHGLSLPKTATALDNGITQICTWNVKHFKTIAELTAKTPEEIPSLAKK